ncbi:hypothetical protein BC829DRAFT_421914 [Chytridium lagenaria]|nr:hypothetical protein BC829DRAFT_421914 [Chytridium lagenaria]
MEDGTARFTEFELDKDKLDFITPLMAGFKKMAEADNIDQVKQMVKDAQQYLKTIPGIDMSEEQQLNEFERLKKVLESRRQQLKTYRELPVFARLETSNTINASNTAINNPLFANYTNAQYTNVHQPSESLISVMQSIPGPVSNLDAGLNSQLPDSNMDLS